MGDLVHEDADVLGPHRRPVAAAGPQHPLEAAAPEAVDARRRHPHRVAGAPPGPVVGEVAQGPPLRRVGAGHALAGEPAERGDGLAAPGRVVGGEGPAQVGHEPLEGQRAGHVGERPRVRQRVDDVEEGRGLLVLAAHGGDDEPLPGPGDGHVEEPGLVVAHLRPGGPRVAGAAGDEVDEVRGAEQRAAQAQVGPHPLLHPGDDDEVPLQAGGCRGRHQRDRLPRGCAGDQRVAGDVLPQHGVEEVGRGGAGQPVDEARGGVEQAQHGIQVAVGASSTGAAGERGVAPRAGQAAGAPHPPEHLLDALTVAQRVDRRREHPVGAPGRGGLGAEPVERERREHGLGEQHVTGPTPAVVELEAPQRAPQPAQQHGIRTADR